MEKKTPTEIVLALLQQAASDIRLSTLVGGIGGHCLLMYSEENDLMGIAVQLDRIIGKIQKRVAEDS